MDVVELHDATSPEELFALESLGFFKPGDAGPATVAGDTLVGGTGRDRQPQWRSGSTRPPLAATGIAQVVELVDQLAVAPVPARSRARDWRWRPIPVA